MGETEGKDKGGQKLPPEVRKRVLEAFGEDLRHHRKVAELSQEGLAKLTGMHFSEIGVLERGRREPRLVTSLKLATALDIPVERLLETAVDIYRHGQGGGRLPPP